MVDEQRFETDLHQALRTIGESISPPVSALVAGGLAKGAKAKRRRLALTAAAASVTAVATATVVVAALGVGNPTGTAARDDTMNGSDVVAITLSLLPKGAVPLAGELGTTHDVPPPRTPGANPSTVEATGEVVVRNAGVTAGLSVYYGHDFVVTCAHAAGPCSTRTLADGSTLMTTSSTYPLTEGNTLVIVLTRPDQTIISLYENGDLSGHMPLTADQLLAVAQSPLWQDTVPARVADAADRLNVSDISTAVPAGPPNVPRDTYTAVPPASPRPSTPPTAGP